MDCLKSAACGFVDMYVGFCVSTSFQIALNLLKKGISEKLFDPKQSRENLAKASSRLW